jgi:type 1 glutamine amidotransferase
MRNNTVMLCALFCLVLSLFCIEGHSSQTSRLDPFFRPGAIRVLILSGHNNHDWRTTTPYLRKLLVDSGFFDVRVCEEPMGITFSTLNPYHVLVLDYGGPRWGEVTEKAVEAFVNSGKGMVVVHGSSYSFSGLDVLADHHKGTGIKEPPWPEFAKMVGCYWPDPPKIGFHGPRHSFQVKIAELNHPIVQGMNEWFWATDELYRGMKILPQANILAIAYDDPKYGGNGKNEPMLVTTKYGDGRVFYTALGHEVPAMTETGFVTTFLRGTEWAATGKVSLPPDVGTPKPKKDALRVLVVTGGHDYETSFYTVFEGSNDWVWDHATSSQQAFNTDIRPQYEVLVLYDMSQELDENGRKNLKDFVEDGKGVVVLHHAIADYNSWSWWTQEVVGGKYVLKAEGGMPESTYKHDEELFVQPVSEHPILADIGPIHLWDETYKGMWISPKVQVLLKTENPTSDGPVTWISPYPKSRVVYIQLGHDHMAHRHPAYRELVKNAILWSAGRLK